MGEGLASWTLGGAGGAWAGVGGGGEATGLAGPAGGPPEAFALREAGAGGAGAAAGGVSSGGVQQGGPSEESGSARGCGSLSPASGHHLCLCLSHHCLSVSVSLCLSLLAPLSPSLSAPPSPCPPARTCHRKQVTLKTQTSSLPSGLHPPENCAPLTGGEHKGQGPELPPSHLDWVVPRMSV